MTIPTRPGAAPLSTARILDAITTWARDLPPFDMLTVRRLARSVDVEFRHRADLIGWATAYEVDADLGSSGVTVVVGGWTVKLHVTPTNPGGRV